MRNTFLPTDSAWVGMLISMPESPSSMSLAQSTSNSWLKVALPSARVISHTAELSMLISPSSSMGWTRSAYRLPSARKVVVW